MKRMKRWPWLDLLTIAGVLLISGGAAWIYPAAGLIVLGIQVVAIGIALDIAKQRNKRRGPR